LLESRGFEIFSQRIKKRFIEGSIGRTTWYIRDASGNIMSIYTEARESLTWESAPIYGSSRVGSYEPGIELPNPCGIK
jgi:hypothetical protein